MISHLVAIAITTVALAATGAAQPAEDTGAAVTHIGTAISIVGGEAPAKLEAGNALALAGNAAREIVR
jgi:hypothetical protein